MKPYGRIVVLLASVALLALLLMALPRRLQRELWRSDHRPPSFVASPLSGDVLDIARLKQNESVLFDCLYLGCDPGSDRAKRYLIGGDARWMTVWDCQIGWAATPEPTIVSPVLRGAYPFDENDLRGFAAMIQAFRFRPVNGSTAAVAYRVEYRRENAVIGEERFILPPSFEFSSTDFQHDRFRSVTEDYGIPEVLVSSVVSPDLVAERAANQSPEATPGQRPPAAPSPFSGAPRL